MARHAYAISTDGRTALRFGSAALRDFFVARTGFHRSVRDQYRVVEGRDRRGVGRPGGPGYNAMDMEVLEYWDGDWADVLDAAITAGLL